jgi:hypothetical protein
MARLDWEDQPTAEGIIINAFMDDVDNIRVEPTDVGDDVGNLIMFEGVFVLTGKRGTLKKHGYTNKRDLIGKKCLLYSSDRFEIVAIEPEYIPVIWVEYI